MRKEILRKNYLRSFIEFGEQEARSVYSGNVRNHRRISRQGSSFVFDDEKSYRQFKQSRSYYLALEEPRASE